MFLFQTEISDGFVLNYRKKLLKYTGNIYRMLFIALSTSWVMMGYVNASILRKGIDQGKHTVCETQGDLI